MTLQGAIHKIIGRYGPTNVTRAFRNRFGVYKNAGYTIRETRRLMRSEGYRMSNQSISELNKEFKAIRSLSKRVRYLPHKAKPSPRTIVKLGIQMGRRYRYEGLATYQSESQGTYTEPVLFSDDGLLTGEQIRERFWDIAEQSAAQGGPPRGKQTESPNDPTTRVVKVVITGVFESAP